MSRITKGNNFLSGFGNENYLEEFVMGKSSDDTPATYVFENEKEYRIEMAVPGFDKEELILKLDSTHLFVSGKKAAMGKKESGKKLNTDYTLSKQWFYLPDNVNRLGIRAEYNNGILEILLPKKENSEVALSEIKVH